MTLADEYFTKAQKAGKVSDNSKFFSVTDKKTVMVDGEADRDDGQGHDPP